MENQIASQHVLFHIHVGLRYAPQPGFSKRNTLTSKDMDRKNHEQSLLARLYCGSPP